MSLVVVKPQTVTAEMLDTSIPEDDYPAWASATTYAADARVVHVHKVWQSLQAGNTGKSPAESTTWWVEVGPTNRWKAFDLSHSTKTRFSDSAWFEITPGRAVNSVALLEFDGLRSVRVRVIDPAYGTVYDKTTVLWTTPGVAGWYPWTFGERRERRNFNALDLPSYRGATIRIDVEAANDAGIGVILVGQQQSIGMGVLAGMQMGMRDYSRKEVDQWGDVKLQQRGYSRNRQISLKVDSKDIDNVDRILSSIRATPVLWLISEKFDQSNVYGWYSNYEIVIQYATDIEISISIEGLVEN